ncbi:MAG: hypothetical protein L6416_01610 [Candidatus Omnitrophica bacterium]|nr:hypothetical protein [Candidatus Omnitrophota bacterium]
MKRVFLGLLVIMVMSFSNYAFAAPIDLPLGIKNSEDCEEIAGGLSISVENEFILKQKLKDSDSEIDKADFHSVKFIRSFSPGFIPESNCYLTLGQAQDLRYRANLSGSDVEFNLENGILWGIGINMIVSGLEDSNELAKIFLLIDKAVNTFLGGSEDAGIKIFVDAKYRRLMDLDYKSVTINGVSYTGDEVLRMTKKKWYETQVSLGLSKNLGVFVPYAGIKCAYIKTSTGATIGSTAYNLIDTGADKNVGLFLGCSLLPSERLYFDLEGCFLNENAVTFQAGYRF